MNKKHELGVVNNKEKVNTQESCHGLCPNVYDLIHLPSVNGVLKSKLFLLLRESISLDKEYKLKIIDRMENLSNYQVNELIYVFYEEKVRWKKILLADVKSNVIPFQKHKSLCCHDSVKLLQHKANIEWNEIAEELKRRFIYTIK